MNKVTAAIKELRKTLGDSQERFAARLDLSPRAVAGYEMDQPPALGVLFLLMRTALSSGLPEQGTVFRLAIEKQIGSPLWPVAAQGEENLKISAVLRILRSKGSKYIALQQKLNELIAPEEQAIRAQDFRASVNFGMLRMIQEGLAAGLNDEQIMAKAPKADQIALQGMLTMARGMQKLEAKRKGDQ